MSEKSTTQQYSSFFIWKRKRRAKKALHQALDLFSDLEKQQEHTSETRRLAEQIKSLSKAIDDGDVGGMSNSSGDVDQVLKAKKKSLLGTVTEFIVALVVALFLAAVIRQVWFELYEIPTGSMRPTFEEQDSVLVSKTAFGINIPFVTAQCAFSPNLVERGVIATITGDKLDLPDVDTVYFRFFPGKRRYVKRVVGRPGDWLYFYGGDIFALESDGKTIRRLKEDPLLHALEYVPFLQFEGKSEALQGSRFGRQRILEISHMNLPIARIEYSPDGRATSFVRTLEKDDKKWIPQFSEHNSRFRSTPQTIGDFWGIKNFAKARLLPKRSLPPQAARYGYNNKDADVWLELQHSPTLPEGPQMAVTGSNPFSPLITVRTWVPLYEAHCERLSKSLYTARFVVENGRLHRYHYEGAYKESQITPPRRIPDGTYEFYHGKAYSISSSGKATLLPESHPIYPKSTDELIFWYNCGIDMAEEMISYGLSFNMPNRYVYFRDGDLVTMGHVLMDRIDPVLAEFSEREITRQAKDFSYFAFQDPGSPLQDPSPEFFQAYGFKVPEEQYLLLGDNHAMSLDSRYFGPVPGKNIQGSPVLIFWPTGSRWGLPLQPHSLKFSPYSAAFVTIVGSTTLFFFLRRSRRRALTLKKIMGGL